MSEPIALLANAEGRETDSTNDVANVPHESGHLGTSGHGSRFDPRESVIEEAEELP
jgi:hypothetical protein